MDVPEKSFNILHSSAIAIPYNGSMQSSFPSDHKLLSYLKELPNIYEDISKWYSQARTATQLGSLSLS